MKIAVADLHPNPFRDLKRYPVKTDKVEALVHSIKDTTFWDNLLVRKAPNDGYEIAYGHNRLAALKKLRIDDIDVPVRQLSDTEMAKIMAHENMEEWGSSADIEAETVRAIVKGFADSRIELPKAVIDSNRIRYAPFFRSGGSSNSGRPELAYSAASLAKFLGWNESKVEAILGVLATTETGLLDEADTVGLTTYQAEAVATQAKRIARETEDRSLAKTIGKRLAQGMRSTTGKPSGRLAGHQPKQEVTYRTAREKADAMVPPNKRKIVPSTKLKPPKAMPPIERYVDSIAPKLGAMFPSPKWSERLEAVIKHAHWLPKGSGHSLLRSLRALADRANRYADRLERAMEA